MALVSRDPNKVTSCHPEARSAWLPIIGDFWCASKVPGLATVLLMAVTAVCCVGATLCAIGATLRFVFGIACVGFIALPALHQLCEWAVLLAALSWVSVALMMLASTLEGR